MYPAPVHIRAKPIVTRRCLPWPLFQRIAAPSFGKYLFAACDVLNGWLIHNLLLNRVLPRALSNDRRARLATMYSALHLLNPLVFTISTRGSSEAVLSLFVLLTLHTALNGRWDAAAVLMGASTHWKIYPLVYGVACLGAIGGVGNAKGMNDYARALVNAKTVRFAVLSAGTFVFLGLGCYAVWGYPFLYESYLYHVHRLDHRHNFSPYFYLIYLTYGSSTENLSIWNRILRSPLTSFGPQMALTLGSGLLFGRAQASLSPGVRV
ncbi:unnamed protein product [Mycena citricolor]|uniref:GPI mannosyltransferase 1 n=1 Tax=Mycena citricolor TaxID=2018698 RepID=A0AAD2GVR0_9AGAR|nr:unnamed protein product [Mycena citricolor]